MAANLNQPLLNGSKPKNREGKSEDQRINENLRLQPYVDYSSLLGKQQ